MGLFQICFDDLSTILDADEDYECKKVGMWREDP